MMPPSTVSQTNSDVVAQGSPTAASADETVPQISNKDSQKTSVQPVKDAGSTVSRDDVTGAADGRADAGELSEQPQCTASAANNNKTLTAADESKVQQMSSEQEQAANSVAKDDSAVHRRSSKELKQVELSAEVGDVTASSSVAVTSGKSSEVSSKMPVTQDSSCPKSDTAASDERTTQESTTTLSQTKDDECGKGDTSHSTSGDVTQEKMANETASSNKDGGGDTGGGSEKETGVVPTAESVSDKKDVEDTRDTSLKEQQLRQIMTLPSQLLSHVNPSLPISLTLEHHHDRQIAVPAANIYQSASGLRLLLPADTLPLEYMDSRQLACTLLGRSDDVSQLQQISISLTVH